MALGPSIVHKLGSARAVQKKLTPDPPSAGTIRDEVAEDLYFQRLQALPIVASSVHSKAQGVVEEADANNSATCCTQEKVL
mmetsp:Transcript_4106/g.7415  ORF Transcript_4106/g.7415 Transcript_4106/m.7415 type:complete len:81 (-) Transcript_4106:1258-1500(-)